MKITKPILLATPFLIASSCCQKASAPPAQTRAACVLPQGGDTPPALKITSGCYRVCKISGLLDHKDPNAAPVKGVHLSPNDLVEIGPISPNGTKLWIIKAQSAAGEERGSEREAHIVNMSGDENALQGYSDFIHQKNGGETNVTHQLRIARTAANLKPSECTLDNVLKISFCFEMPVNGVKQWVCKDPNVLGDLGHGHIEN